LYKNKQISQINQVVTNLTNIKLTNSKKNTNKLLKPLILITLLMLSGAGTLAAIAKLYNVLKEQQHGFIK
jgi:hypothetical protein